MTHVKTAISLDSALFEDLEDLAGELKTTRSRLVALALKEFLHRYESRKLLERIDAAYQEGPDPAEQALLHRMSLQHRRLVEGEW